MRTMKYVTLAALTATGLALAGCGGGSKKPVAMGDQQMEMTPVQKAQAAYDAAAAAKTATMAAEKVAKMQLDAAKKASPTERIYTTGGDSSMVRTNAAAVMAAKAAAEKALADAKAEMMKIDEALKALNALPAGTTGLAAQKRVVDQQSKDVAALIKTIEGYLTGAGSIAVYAARVDTEAELILRTGEDLAPAGFDNTESSRVARRMLAILSPLDSQKRTTAGIERNPGITVVYNNRPTGTLSGAASPPTKLIATGDNADRRSMFYYKYDDGELPAGVMTWEQIAAKEGMLVKKAFGADDADVDVLPLAGMPLSVLTTSSGTALKELAQFTSGMLADQYYKGVKGTLYCQGKCPVDEGKLTGKLFFKAAGPSDDGNAGNYRYYWITPTNSHYTQWNAYVRYGYWLYGTGSTTGIVLSIASPAAYRGDLTKNSALPATATYKGEAFGLSALKLYTDGEHTGQKSARFTADVTLNAKFGDAGERKLGGTVNNFKGNAVDERWSVKLAETAQDNYDVYRASATGSAGAAAHDTPGEWHSNPFSQNGVGRPAGIAGTFNTHFPNGHAAGAFSTRIQTETTE